MGIFTKLKDFVGLNEAQRAEHQVEQPVDEGRVAAGRAGGRVARGAGLQPGGPGHAHVA